MNIKIKILSLALISLITTHTVFALTSEDVDLLYKMGFISESQISTARSAVKNSQTTVQEKPETKFIYGANNSTSSSSCLKFTSDLYNGMSSSNVTALQKFLKTQGHFSAEPTGYFGKVTQSSVEKFQIAQSIVLNGTPETTGFGNVGPSTRSSIEKISCAGVSSQTGTNNFFGTNLDDYFTGGPDLSYDVKLNTDIDFNTNVDYNPQTNFKVADIKFDDIDFNTDIDFKTDINLDYNFGDNVFVRLYAKAVNGQFLRGGTNAPVAVPSKDVKINWESKDTKECFLSGDFKEKSLSAPSNGSATLTLTTPSAGSSYNGSSLYRLKVSCNASTTKAYVLPSSDSLLLWVYNASSTTTN